MAAVDVWSGGGARERARVRLTTEADMSSDFKPGDHVSWNSEAGRVSGTIRKVHRHDFQWKGHTRHCTPDDPQYEIESDRTDHVAMHKGSALRKLD